MKTLLILLAILLSCATYTQAYDATIEANWAWNGTEKTVQGFRFYMDDIAIHDAIGPDIRTDSWTFEMANGAHTFTMTAYGDGWESVKSPEYKFEYLYIDKKPAPTFFIRIN